MQRIFQIACAGFLLMLASHNVDAAVCADDRDLDACLSSGDPVASCQKVLDRNKNDASARLSLCEVYVRKGELEKARAVVQQGIDLCGRRRCGELKLAESNVRERQQRAARQLAAPMDAGSRDRAYCTGPIANTRSIDACERLLKSNRNDVPVAEGLADKLLKTNKPTKAVLVLTDTVNLTTLGRSLLTKARQAHQANVQRCLQGSNLAVCDAALLAGDSAEYEIHRKRGELLSASRKADDALRAFQQSVRLNSNDQATAAAIVGLNSADFGASNSSYLESLVAAERLLGNRSGELAALQKLVEVKPDDQTVKARLLTLQPPEPVTQKQVATRVPVKVAPLPVAKTEPALRTAEEKVTEIKTPQPKPTVAATLVPVSSIVQAQPAQQTVQVSTRPATLYANAMDSDGRSH